MTRAFERIAERWQQAPGVAAAGLASAAPFEGGSDNGLIPEGRPLEIGSAIQSNYPPGDARLLPDDGYRLRRGRAFTAQDRAGAPLVMVVNETLARGRGPDRTRSASGSRAASRGRTATPGGRLWSGS